MKKSYITGVSFGTTSGVISTLGMMVGLEAGTGSELAVIGGIVTVAIADAFSDSLSMHLSEESQNDIGEKSIWEATFATFLAKFFVALTFIIPFIFFDRQTAVWISVVWGLALVGLWSYLIAKHKNANKLTFIAEHFAIAIAVIIITYFVGGLLRSNLNI